MVASLFTSLDTQLASWPSDGVTAMVWAALSGIVSMLIYKRFSRQDRLRELDERAATVRQALNDHEVQFAEAVPLLKQNIGLALSRLKLVMLPSLFAGIPVLVVLIGMQECYGSETVLPFGPAWARSWLAAFVVVSCTAALVTKVVLRIR